MYNHQHPSYSFIHHILIYYGKCLSPTVSTPYYSITTYSISGLRWFNPYDDNLNLFALIQTEKFSSLFSTTSNILFLVGINSVRNLPATNVIQQLDQFLHLLFSNYTHLTAGQIIITTCPPCLKISNRYSNISLLQNNIDYYNHLLFSLSSKYKVSVLDLKISFEWLGRDGLHIDYVYREEFSNIILNYINNTNMHQQTSSNVSTRSRYSISKRNRKRNLKIRNLQRNFTLIREISDQWSYYHIKNFLRFNHISFDRLLILSQHTLHLYFNNSPLMQRADQALSINIFNDDTFFHWVRSKP
ncbi:unnamed protein product [Rotaria socialis]|uniref:SGNH hydrolase-type esterase domain-containing protein n=2 Tax=Rotaria socialis TaxID=392032 RepID=A0A818ZWC8_9BILA|nr:unnamed protein product [Rotaria socialis]